MAGVALLAAVLASGESRAATFEFSLSGQGVSGQIVIDYAPADKTGPIPSNPLNSVDPVGSYKITGVSGTFSDAKAGISNATIFDVLGLNRVAPEKGNELAPASFSLFAVQGGINVPGNPPSDGLHYDNLFYPGGSPPAASDFPFGGGIFDIYGLAFNLQIGADTSRVVNVWSNGNNPFHIDGYGVAVVTADRLVAYTNAGVMLQAVPLPASAPLFGAAVLGLAGFGYLAKRKKAAA